MKDTAPEFICSFTYLFVDSFIIHLLQETRHLDAKPRWSLPQEASSHKQLYRHKWVPCCQVVPSPFPSEFPLSIHLKPRTHQSSLSVYCFSNCSMPQNLLEGLLKQIPVPSTPRPETPTAFLTSSQVLQLLLLLVRGPHFEKHCSRTSAFSLELPMSQAHQRQNKESTFS